MKVGHLPENERERISAVRRFEILDSDDDPDFDGIVEIASQICDTSIAVITLLDEKRQWFKARKGINIRETDRDFSFCAHTINMDGVMMVKDASKDDRFNDNPLVTGHPFIRFYAGVSLITEDNYRVGTLAVIDPHPRELSQAQQDCLTKLARQVVNLLNMRRSIIEQKRSNAENAYLAEIIEKTNDAILSIDRLGLIRSWNKGAESLYGYTRSETLGRSVHDIVRGPIIPFEESFEDFFNGPKVWRGEVTHLNKAGEPVFLLLTVSALPNEMHETAGYVLQLRDISERKKLELELHNLHEEAVRAANEKYRKIFENSLHGIFQTTIEGKFITVNPAMAMMFGFSSPEDLMREVTDITRQLYIDPADRNAIRKQLEAEGVVNGFEFKAVRRNKQIIWLRAYIRLVFDKSGMSYFEGMIEDVTDRKIADDKLAKQFEELKKINYELDRFVYSASHDLRAPLSSIQGITNIAEMESPSEIQRQYLQMIRDSIARLDDFIKAILSYSRNTRMEVQLEEIDFRQLTDTMKLNLQSMKGAERLRVKCSINGSGPFYSDSFRIGIILNNLYSNAIKYQDLQKEISECEIVIEVSPDNAVITMSDNGIGIPPQYLKNIFEMFYRAHDISKGSGLGLYIARETAVKLRGSISVESDYGRRTTFKVILPNLMNYY
jgi:PAS domain S-box-containing protein